MKKYFLTCEKNWVYFTLICVAGFWGAYTYLLRGGIFCNAQTGNVVLMGLALGSAQWGKALYYLVPISAYILGAFVSELLPNPLKHRLKVRWDTILIFIEMLAVLALGFVPDSAPVQISQVVINFIASMQYNTFRQAQDIPMATTFCTNHVRQVGVGLVHALHHPEEPRWRRKVLSHLEMLAVFVAGCAAATALSGVFLGRTIWWTLVPLGIVGGWLLYADLKGERGRLEQVPKGH